MAKESFKQKKLRAKKIVKALNSLYPNVKCFLDYSNPLELLIAVMLSAQCTDLRVNKTTPALFKRFKTAKEYAECDILELQELIRSTGFYKNKAKNIKAMCHTLLDKHLGMVPGTLEELTKLPGVGRKTANVVLSEIWNIPSMVVDTHVTRLSNRLGLAKGEDAVKLEFELMQVIEKKHWSKFSHWIISHGRQICSARKPLCNECGLLSYCKKIGI